MRVTLIHNPGAGTEDQPDAKKLAKLIKAAGHDVTYQSTKAKRWTVALKKAADLIAVAGGDGTVSQVARRMAGRGATMTVLPMGTANNVARSLGIADASIEDLIAAWESAPRISFDAAIAKGPWGKRRLIEGLGIGLFAWTMPQATDSKALAKIDEAADAIKYVLRMLQDRIEHYKPREIEATLDGDDISGEYVMFEAMNLQYVGPNLHLAPGVEPGDGLLHVVAVTDRERDRLYRYLEHWQKGKNPAVDLPTFEGRLLKIGRGDYEVHIDDRLWPDPEDKDGARPGDIEVEVEPAALDFILPGRRCQPDGSAGVSAGTKKSGRNLVAPGTAA
jgi:diacylglycerol kinase (ATP)